jgi:peptide deformylase
MTYFFPKSDLLFLLFKLYYGLIIKKTLTPYMAILEVLIAPDPILKKKCENVEIVDDSIRAIMDDMLETMYHDDGVGLAANQVGILKKIIVFDLQNDDETERPEGFYPIFMANPEVIDFSKEMIEAKEACISVPGQQISVSRHATVKVKYLDYNNQTKELDAGGWFARAIQHEMDHLDGRILVDYLSSIKKDVVLRKLTKMKKAYA